jgi:flagellar biosynthesis/type III secretory pathway chaperone
MASSDSTSRPEVMRRILSTQLAAATRLRDVLTREYDILRQPTPDGLDALLPEKQAALNALADADRELRDALGNQATARAADIEQSMAQLDATGGLAGTWRQLADVLRECETRNQTNGSLVELSRQHVELALNVLRGETPPTSTYGSNGQTERAARSRSIAEA